MTDCELSTLAHMGTITYRMESQNPEQPFVMVISTASNRKTEIHELHNYQSANIKISIETTETINTIPNEQ